MSVPIFERSGKPIGDPSGCTSAGFFSVPTLIPTLHLTHRLLFQRISRAILMTLFTWAIN